MFIPPLPPRDDRPDGEQGFVSLRDHLAMSALVGILSGRSRPEYISAVVASECYSLADAMLVAREVKR